MLDIGWSELLVIAVLTVVVVGPKDLPKVIRTIGQWTSRARSVVREFQSHVDDMVRESELDELRRKASMPLDVDISGPPRNIAPEPTRDEVYGPLPPDGAVTPDGPAPAAAIAPADADAPSGERFHEGSDETGPTPVPAEAEPRRVSS